MKKSLDQIENTLTGEKFIFPANSAPRLKDSLQLEMVVKPGAEKSFGRILGRQTVRFSVIGGSLYLKVDDREITLASGQTFVVPIAATHCYWNKGKKDAWVFLEITPGIRSRRLLEELTTAANKKKQGHLMDAHRFWK